MFRPSMRSCWLAMVLTLAAGLPYFSAATSCGGADELAQSSTPLQTDLKQQLEKGLRARRPVEFQFIALVVTMVENDTLPLDLVKSTFLWARKKALTTQYPFPYFERALRERAARQGINIP